MSLFLSFFTINITDKAESAFQLIQWSFMVWSMYSSSMNDKEWQLKLTKIEGVLPLRAGLVKYTVDSTIDLFEHFNTEKLMEIAFLAVLPEYGNRGIGYELAKVDLQLLAELHENFKGPDVISAVWTTNISTRIGERLGFQVLSECFYNQMENGDVKLSEIVDSQHECARVSAKKLEKKH